MRNPEDTTDKRTGCETGLAAQDFIDRARPAIDPAVVVDHVQLVEQAVEPESGKCARAAGSLASNNSSDSVLS